MHLMLSFRDAASEVNHKNISDMSAILVAAIADANDKDLDTAASS